LVFYLKIAHRAGVFNFGTLRETIREFYIVFGSRGAAEVIEYILCDVVCF